MATANEPTKLDGEKIEDRMLRLRGWSQEDGAISRTLRFRNFKESKAFVDKVAELAEREQHHPDIHIEYDKVRLVLSTHSAGGLTDKDFDMAEEIDRMAADR
jgi:4a-hydroxytetrahydrobiopterin dehydratase